MRARGDEERIRDAGAEGYVSKPISVMRFVEAVSGLLEMAAQATVLVSSPANRARRKPNRQQPKQALPRIKSGATNMGVGHSGKFVGPDLIRASPSSG
jgi:DNA-binding NarL/FixJ family response regulator